MRVDLELESGGGSSTASSKKGEVDESNFSGYRWPFLAVFLKYLVCFLFGIGVGVGIVCLVLRSYGLLGGGSISTYQADFVDLGELPVNGDIQYGFVDLHFQVAPIDKAAPFQPTNLLLFRRPVADELDYALVSQAPYSASSLMTLSVERLGPGEEFMYRYAVEFSDGRLSNYSPPVRVRQRDAVPPVAPTPLKLRADTTSLLVAWQGYGEEQARRLFGGRVLEYRVVEYRLDDGTQHRRTHVHHIRASLTAEADTAMAYRIEDLQPEEVVGVRLEAASEAGVSVRSEELLFRTNAAEQGPVPRQISGVAVVAKYAGGVVEWPVRDGGREGGSDVLHYDVEVVPILPDSGQAASASAVVLRTHTNRLELRNLERVRYAVRVRAVSSFGAGEWSVAVEWRVSEFCDADAPVGVRIKHVWRDAFSVSFTLSSPPLCALPVTAVRVIRLDAPLGSPRVLCEQTELRSRLYCDAVVAEGRKLRVAVVAVNAAGEGVRSGAVLTVQLNDKVEGKCNTISDARWFVHAPDYNPDTHINWKLAECAKRSTGDPGKSLACLRRHMDKLLKQSVQRTVLSAECSGCFEEMVKCGGRCAMECKGGNAIHEPACIQCNKPCKAKLNQCAGLDKSLMPPDPSAPVHYNEESF